MGIGIDIDVKSEKVAKAQKLIDQMSKSLDEAGGKSEIKIGPETVDVTAVNAVSKGASAYRKEMEGAANALNKMVKDYDKLIKMPKAVIGTGATQVIRPSLAPSGTYAAQNSALQNSIENMFGKKSKHAPFGEQFRRDNPNWRPPGGGGDEDQPGRGGGGGSLFPGSFKKALGWGLAAVGGFSVLSYLAQSRAKYQESVGPQGTLYARGIRGGYGNNIGIGMGPLDQMDLLENLSQGSGLTGGAALSAAKMSGRFSKAMGTSSSDVAGLFSTIYKATGNNNLLPTGVLVSMGRATEEGLKKAKIPELLQLVSRNTNITAQAMNGAGVSSGQLQAGTNLAIAGLMSSGKPYGQYMKSSNFADFMQNGFQGAGTTAGDIMLNKALGLYDGTMSFGKIHKMNLLRQEGPLQHPEMMDEIIKGMRGGTVADRAGLLGTMFPKIKGAPAEHLINMSEAGFFVKMKNSGKSLDDLAKSGDAAAKTWKALIDQNPATSKQALMARSESLQITIGQDIHNMFSGIENAALNSAKSLIESSFGKTFTNSVHKFSEAVNKFAMNPSAGTFNGIQKSVSANLPLVGKTNLVPVAEGLAGIYLAKKLLGSTGQAFVKAATGSGAAPAAQTARAAAIMRAGGSVFGKSVLRGAGGGFMADLMFADQAGDKREDYMSELTAGLPNMYNKMKKMPVSMRYDYAKAYHDLKSRKGHVTEADLSQEMANRSRAVDKVDAMANSSFMDAMLILLGQIAVNTQPRYISASAPAPRSN